MNDDIVIRKPRVIDLRTHNEGATFPEVFALTVSAMTVAGLVYLAVCIFA